MNPKTATRNVAFIRNILLEELLEEYVTLWLDNQAPEVLYDVLRCRTRQHVVARRLQITMPDSSKLVGRVVQRAYFRDLKARKCS